MNKTVQPTTKMKKDEVCPVCSNRTEDCICCPECGHECVHDQEELYCPVCGPARPKNTE